MCGQQRNSLGHSLQNALWLSPTPSQNFCETFAKISADPSRQQGAHQRKRKHQGSWCLALAKPHFWKLGCCIWSLSLETSEKATLGITSGRCKDALQRHGIWLWRSLVFGSLAATYEGKGKCTVPFSCRNPGRREW